MFTLPEPCTAEQAITAVREWHVAEEQRLWESYSPDPDDSGEFPALEPDAEPGPSQDDEWAEVVAPELEQPEEEPAFEPSPEDRLWLAPLALAGDVEEADWREFARWAERLDAMHRVTDHDVLAATGCVG